MKATRTLGIIPNGLRVTYGKKERFVVYGNKEWVEAISRAMAGP